MLLVEDSPTQAEGLRLILEEAGHRVTTCASAEEALGALGRERFGLVIADVRLPRMSGYELCRALRSDAGSRGLPVLLLTALEDPRDVISALECGADSFLRKPFAPEALLERVRSLLESRRLRAVGPGADGLKLTAHGHTFHFAPGREQLLDVVVATFDEMVRTNRELELSRAELASAKGKLEEYAQRLEGRVMTSEAKYARLVESATDAIVLLDVHGRILEANRSAEQVFGRLREGLRGRSFASLLAPEELERGRAALARLLKEGGVALEGLRCLRPGSADVLIDASASVLPADSGGSLVMVIGRDVTERRRMEALLRASEQRFRSVVSSMKDLVLTQDALQRVDGVFGNWLADHGRRPEDFLGKGPSELFCHETAALHAAANARALRGEHVVFEWPEAGCAEDKPFCGPDPRHFQTALSPLSDGSGAVVGLVSVTRETTELKKAQAQLMVADRMASVGILAAGVAHEINNPLAAVIANLDLAKEDGADPGEVVAMLKDAREAAERVRQTVRQLRVFSHPGDERRGQVQVNALLDSILKMAANEIRHRALLVKDFQAVPPAFGNEGQLGQVFLNLVINAAQAIPEGQAEKHELRVSTRTDAAGQVVVEVKDTGSGMSPEVLRRIFTPFFTTKPVGVGTGLGLSICHRIVASVGGAIQVESQKGKGSLFRVLLRPATQPVAPAEAPAPGPSPAARKGRILVVDDEPMMVRAVRRVLENDHELKATTRAAEALEWLLAGERFDLILCDLMMPQMTGMDLHARLAEANPEQAARMVFFSGGSFTERAKEFLGGVQGRYLEKPVAAAELRRFVNELLS